MEILSSRFMLHPSDLARSIDFYQNVLGLHPMREFGRGEGRGIVFFLGGGYLEITGGAAAPPTSATELRAADPDGLVLIFVEVPKDHPLRRDHRSM